MEARLRPSKKARTLTSYIADPSASLPYSCNVITGRSTAVKLDCRAEDFRHFGKKYTEISYFHFDLKAKIIFYELKT